VRDRGCGFIRTAHGQRIFSHATGVSGILLYDSLRERQRVYFQTAPNPRAAARG
jgi:cold shock CspA family protein